jgi:hypothetical protein
MTDQDFIDNVYLAVGHGRPAPRVADRPLHMALNRAHYGRPSAVVIEAQGSPTWASLYVDNLQYGANARAVLFCGRRVSSGRGKVRVCELVDQFIRSKVGDAS